MKGGGFEGIRELAKGMISMEWISSSNKQTPVTRQRHHKDYEGSFHLELLWQGCLMWLEGGFIDSGYFLSSHQQQRQ